MDVNLLMRAGSPVWALDLGIGAVRFQLTQGMQEAPHLLVGLLGEEEMLRQREPNIFSGADYVLLVMSPCVRVFYEYQESSDLFLTSITPSHHSCF